MKEIKLDDNGLEKSIPTEYKIESERESASEINQTESLIVNESDRFAIINKPIDLPRIPTIYDIRIDGNLPESIELIINNLSEVYPKASFDNLTPLEIIEIQKDNINSKNMSREEIWKTIKPFFNSVFTLQLGDILPKMKEISKRSDNNPDYVPTYEHLVIIAKRILDARRDLFASNIDLNAKRFNHIDNPIEFLLMLMKVQREMYPKRNEKISETFFTKFKFLIQSHAELMVKLNMNGKTGDDFFGSKYTKLRNELRMLKGVSYNSFGGRPLTIKQQTTLINIIDDYKKTLELIFTFSDDDRMFFNQHLFRPNKNDKLASLEIYHTFDDSSNNRSSQRFKELSYGSTSCEIINSIYLSGNYGKPLDNIYKNSISMQNLTDYVCKYFSLAEKSERDIKRENAINKKTTTQKIIIGMFFDILDKYLI